MIQMAEGNSVTYIQPELCVSRACEILAERHDAGVKLDLSGAIEVQKGDAAISSPTTSELKLRAAWQRKALAFDLARVISLEAMEEWHTYLFGTMVREFRPVDMHQVILADKQMWLLLSNLIAPPCQPKPAEVLLWKLSASTEVLQYLSPLPSSQASSSSSAASKRHVPENRNEPNAKRPKGKGSAKGRVDIPDGCSAKTEDGRPVCYTSGCKFAAPTKGKVQPGKRCMGGFHCCWKIKCGKPCPHPSCSH